MAKVRIVPLRRTIKRGMKGGDVVALKRALSRAGYLRWGGFTRKMGRTADKALRRFQRDQRLLADGEYGAQTHKRLAKHFDAYGAWLMGAIPRRDDESENDVRARIVAAMTLLYHHAPEVHYTQGPRRMEGVTRRMRPPIFPRYADCSSAATWAYYVAGAADPNGAGYNGTGYTGTLSRKGRVVDLAHARPGDLVFYGRGWPWHHVAVYCGHGRVLSHGSEGGPYLLAVDYRGDRGEIRSYLS